ncbi:phosphotransferase [Acidithiobacillus ferrooxidans]|uniref:phosphotransferase enzyme family protein n=1 Tax=Acidithiobacillus ferrooxidans TaxID=920 RepID=UPI000B032EDE|nr:phosphotransferase [Acidithiobacillus ferrooxidans]MCR2831607.1 phosphotransferase [Acidithiobacillus ferrooxidans]
MMENLISLITRHVKREYPQISRNILDISFITSSENYTYRLNCGENKYSLRLQISGYHSRNDIQAELRFVEMLNDRSIKIARPVSTFSGENVSTFSAPAGDILVSIFEWIDGEHPTPEQYSQIYGQLGLVMGTMHNISESITPLFFGQRPFWNFDRIIGDNAVWGSWYQPHYVSQKQEKLVKHAIHEIRKRLDQHHGNKIYGLIHADMRPTNVLVKDNELVIIDFDDCCHSWYMFDIAASVSFLEHDQNVTYWLNKLLRNYLTVRDLHQGDLDVLPYFIAMRRIQLMAWYFSHINSEFAKTLGPEWFACSYDVIERVLQGEFRFSR